MSSHHTQSAGLRSRWGAIGAAVAVTLGVGGIGVTQAAVDSGDKPITVTVESKRILDTREDLGLTGAFTNATPRDLQVTGDVPVAPSGTEVVVPDDAIGVLVNVTVVNPTDPGFLALRSGGATGDPETSTVNFTAAGAVEPNAATVDLSDDGTIQVWVTTASPTGTADVLVDIVGYTIDHTHDDRYYTEDEADSVHATKADTADVPTVAYAGGNQTASIDTTGEVLRTVTLTPPSDGTIIVQSMVVTDNEAGEITQCSITTDEAVDEAYNQGSGTVSSDGFFTVSGIRGYEATSGVPLAVNLFCRVVVGPGPVTMFDSNMVATFYATDGAVGMLGLNRVSDSDSDFDGR